VLQNVLKVLHATQQACSKHNERVSKLLWQAMCSEALIIRCFEGAQS
jgi:hypothetical protein